MPGGECDGVGCAGRRLCCFKEAASCVRNCCRCFLPPNEVGFFGGLVLVFFLSLVKECEDDVT